MSLFDKEFYYGLSHPNPKHVVGDLDGDGFTTDVDARIASERGASGDVVAIIRGWAAGAAHDFSNVAPALPSVAIPASLLDPALSAAAYFNVPVSVPDPVPVAVPDPVPGDLSGGGHVTSLDALLALRAGDAAAAQAALAASVGNVPVAVPDPVPVAVPDPVPVAVPDPVPVAVFDPVPGDLSGGGHVTSLDALLALQAGDAAAAQAALAASVGNVPVVEGTSPYIPHGGYQGISVLQPGENPPGWVPSVPDKFPAWLAAAGLAAALLLGRR